VRPSLPDDPLIPHNGFQTVEEGEKAFVHLLRKAGVDASWTWDQTMRAIITDPLYKALNTLAEKKACWEKYTNGLKVKEQEEREARLSKLRPAIRNMLKGNPNVFYYSTFKTADKLFANHPIWQQAKIEAERKLIFEEYVTELKEREVVRFPPFWCRFPTLLIPIQGRNACRPFAQHLQSSRTLQRTRCQRRDQMAHGARPSPRVRGMERGR
jgi:hypothetical protein